MQPWKKKDLTITEAFFTQKIGKIVKSGERIEFTPDQIYNKFSHNLYMNLYRTFFRDYRKVIIGD